MLKLNTFMINNKGSIGACGGLITIMSGIWTSFQHVKKLETRLDTIENNHLKHIEDDMKNIKDDIKSIKIDLTTMNINIITRIDKLYELQINNKKDI